jgi:hypothetical protein
VVDWVEVDPIKETGPAFDSDAAAHLMPAKGFWPRELDTNVKVKDVYHKTTVQRKDIKYSAIKLPLLQRSLETPTHHSHSLPALHQKFVSNAVTRQPAWRPNYARPVTAPQPSLMNTQFKPLKLLSNPRYSQTMTNLNKTM